MDLLKSLIDLILKDLIFNEVHQASIEINEVE